MSKRSLNQDEIDIKQFKKIKRISRGGFGVVYLVEDKKTKEQYAAKIIDCEDDEDKCEQMIKREISIMMYAKHPTIIKFIGYSKVDFHKENNITIIMQLAKNGSLRDILKKIQEGDGPKDYTNTTRQIILIGVSRGMKYLHDRDIIHRDLKTDNILLDEDFHPYITDFGLSKFIDVGHSYSQTKFGGTLPYEAPEILRKAKYGKKVDVYSFGILMFEVLTDTSAYPELEREELADFDFKNMVANKNYRPKFKYPIKKSLQELIEKCWSDDPNERPTFDEIFSNLQEDDFLLDDVDVDEVNLYVEDISEVTDNTEKLLKRIATLETENKQLRNEIDELKSENKLLRDKINDSENDNKNLNQTKQELKMHPTKDQIKPIKNEKKYYKKSIIVGGYNYYNQLDGKSNNTNSVGSSIISPPFESSLDPSSLLSYSVYYNHSVLVMSDGSLKGVGDNRHGQISATLEKTKIENFTDFCIKDGSGHQLTAISAVCGYDGTLYMFSKSSGNGRQLVLCNYHINEGDPVFLDIGNHHPVSLFGGLSKSAAIGSEGEIIFIYPGSIKKSPKSPIAAFSLPDGEKASSVAFSDFLVFVLSSNGRVFTSRVQFQRSVLNFSIVSELSGQEIVCLSGTSIHCLAVNKKGRVFGSGSNDRGQLGLSKKKESVESFTEIESLSGYKIRAAYAGCGHSLFETQEGKVLSCGINNNGELLLSARSENNVYSPTETTITGGASFCIAGDCTSVVFIGSSPPSNTPNIQI